jgi:hypothetical protein
MRPRPLAHTGTRFTAKVGREGAVDYAARLGHDRRWALGEADRYFAGQSAPHQTLKRITQKLDELGLPYTVVEALAMFQHGYRRITEDVDLLVSRDSLRQIHDKLDGLGYAPPSRGVRTFVTLRTASRSSF